MYKARGLYSRIALSFLTGLNIRMGVNTRTAELETVNGLPLDGFAGVCLFQVLQEAVHNAVKHSRAKRVEVQLTGGLE